MDPGEPAKTQVAKPVKKPIEKVAETPKVVATDKAKESSSYSLNGG